MSVVSARSTTGCLACKTKHKKCDETKPHCLRCQKSNIECPGYIYINPDKPTRKLRTLLAPRTLVGRPLTRARQGTSSVSPEDADVQAQLSIDYDSLGLDASNSRLATSAVANTRMLYDAIDTPDPWACLSSFVGSLEYPLVDSNISHRPTLNASNSGMATSVAANTGTLSDAIDTSNPWVFLSSFTGSLEHPSVDVNTSHGLIPNATNPDITPMPSTGDPAPLSSGQASLLEALFSLGQSLDTFPRHPRPVDLVPASSALLVSNRARVPPNAEATFDDEDPEGVVGAICRSIALDKTTEGNALPFVLQSYAAWIRRMALEPLKMVRIARDFVFSHFADGDESRWIVTLLANIGGKIGNAEFANRKHDYMLLMLQNVVRRRLATVKTRPTANRLELIKALDSALETIIINFFVGPIGDVVPLRQEAAPIFRQLCPEPPGEPINLQSLLLYPPFCLRHYAHIDILFSVVMDMPTLFRYDTTIPRGPPYPYESVIEIRDDIGLQWLHGTPDPLISLFAKMKSMRDDGLRPSAEVIWSFEREIRELQPFSSPSPESFLMIVRFVVHECWREVAFVYLYMALCGDSSGAPRVKGAFKRFTRLLNGIKPGRLPDEFLIMNLILIAPAAQQKRDREIIRQRILGLNTHSQMFGVNVNLIWAIEDYWARADAEGRQVLWSDVAVSRKRVLGV
ncbi:unnamed protein product [Rhizoctonia solani]|uniref:Zn(2)-C6 fungal-type domain-containing protein n=1 Tax=Rhizoctonia solani TaxID=456999 RepID=A0A8H3CYI2_9AGAM|nr:unnamed protein product [Rhizoctonia solani]